MSTLNNHAGTPINLPQISGYAAGGIAGHSGSVIGQAVGVAPVALPTGEIIHTYNAMRPQQQPLSMLTTTNDYAAISVVTTGTTRINNLESPVIDEMKETMKAMKAEMEALKKQLSNTAAPEEEEHRKIVT